MSDVINRRKRPFLPPEILVPATFAAGILTGTALVGGRIALPPDAVFKAVFVDQPRAAVCRC